MGAEGRRASAPACLYWTRSSTLTPTVPSIARAEAQRDRQAPATIAAALAVCARRWSAPIIYVLGGGSLGFNDILRRLDGISSKVLTETLRRLEAFGVVMRVPPKGGYRLTAAGEALLPRLDDLAAWADEHRWELESGRNERRGRAA